MTRVEALEREVRMLTPEELATFRNWFEEYAWDAWDRQLEQDVADGRLDRFAAEARAEYERGETKEN
jgi:YD repeat-containing protein